LAMWHVLDDDEAPSLERVVVFLMDSSLELELELELDSTPSSTHGFFSFFCFFFFLTFFSTFWGKLDGEIVNPSRSIVKPFLRDSSLGSINVHLTRTLIPLIALLLNHQNHKTMV